MKLEELRQFSQRFFDYHYLLVTQEASRQRGEEKEYAPPTPFSLIELEYFLSMLPNFPAQGEYQKCVAAIFFSCINSEEEMVVNEYLNFDSKISAASFIQHMLNRRPDLIAYLEPVMEEVSQRTILTHVTLTLGVEGMELLHRFLPEEAYSRYYNSLDANKMSSLMYACAARRAAEVRYLLQQAADVTLSDLAGKTALLHAIDAGCRTSIGALVQWHGLSRCAPEGVMHPILYAQMHNPSLVLFLQELGFGYTLPSARSRAVLMSRGPFSHKATSENVPSSATNEGRRPDKRIKKY